MVFSLEQLIRLKVMMDTMYISEMQGKRRRKTDHQNLKQGPEMHNVISISISSSVREQERTIFGSLPVPHAVCALASSIGMGYGRIGIAAAVFSSCCVNGCVNGSATVSAPSCPYE